MQTNATTLTITINQSDLEIYKKIAIRDKLPIETVISKLLTTIANGFEDSNN